ncbi:hypothetical protein EXU30_19720 [Shewanella maritima]|uniref:Uncharacterized protein n=1 Tax=Shewanella maritima TaxID=2520507 RepID=A0A411PMA1_9GAMM|nr:hypothetical protein [Shewanella maritima]QBF84654.1 hypothetical protein EXU30_19720 [Shewanella maritima]
MNRSNIINLAGGQEKAQAALDALRAERPDLAETFNAAPDSAAANAILEMAVRAQNSKTAAPQGDHFKRKNAKEIVQDSISTDSQPMTARVYAESLQRLRKSGAWDGENYNHPAVKELSGRMLQNMQSFRRGNAEQAAKTGQDGRYSGLNLNQL